VEEQASILNDRSGVVIIKRSFRYAHWIQFIMVWKSFVQKGSKKQKRDLDMELYQDSDGSGFHGKSLEDLKKPVRELCKAQGRFLNMFPPLCYQLEPLAPLPSTLLVGKVPVLRNSLSCLVDFSASLLSRASWSSSLSSARTTRAFAC
jgi:hypothetical protein